VVSGIEAEPRTFVDNIPTKVVDFEEAGVL
jgi:hypothetical protein